MFRKGEVAQPFRLVFTDIHQRDGRAGLRRDMPHPDIARGDEEFRVQSGLRHFPSDGVLTATASNNQYSHVIPLIM
jgi:hypothetical protein